MITAETLALSGIRHGFFTRQGGVSAASMPASTAASARTTRPPTSPKIARAWRRRSTSSRIVCSPLSRFIRRDVVVAETPWPPEPRPRADAVVTRTPGLAVGVTTADCGPILLAEPTARVIGAAHAGWRGALGGIAEAPIAAMEKLGADRGRIRAVLGPMIRQSNYEVGPDLMARFAAEDGESARFFRPAPREGHALFDLAGYIGARLSRAGIEQIEDLGLCTYADTARFFSFRRTTHRGEADYGRHVNAIVLT